MKVKQMRNGKKISVVIPAYNEEKIIAKTAHVISTLLEDERIEYEIIFINDGSKDSTWEEICNASITNSNIKGLCFSRNFGKESAMFAGIDCSEGDCLLIIDCDLQHPPEKIVDMYKLWEEGYDVVEGVKKSRGNETKLHGFCAKLFYSIISRVTKIDMSNASDFKLIDRKVIDTLKAMPERNVFFRALSSWVGFSSTKVEFEVRERTEGESKWSSTALVKYAITNIISFSAAPLHLVTVLGLLCFFIAIVFSIISLVQYWMGVALGGFTTVVLLELIIGSIIMTSMGIIGCYLSKMYEELKNRPRYIVSSKVMEGKVD